jgi:Heparinase II/III-like protein
MDPLSITLWGHGRELLPDLGYIRSSAEERPWLRSALSHNTVVVNECDPGQDLPETEGEAERTRRVRGTCRYFHQAPPVASVRAAFAPPYADVRQYDRALLLVSAGAGEAYVVDRFHVAGGHTHDWALHALGETFTTDQVLNPNWFAASGARMNGLRTHFRGVSDYFGLMRNTRYIRTREPWAATWQWGGDNGAPGAVGIRAHLLGGAETDVVAAEAPACRTDASEEELWATHTMLFARRTEPEDTFLAILEPFATQPFLRSVTALPLPAGAKASATSAGLEVRGKGWVDTLLVAEAGDAVVETGAVHLAGEMAVVRHDDAGRFLFAYGGPALALRSGAWSLRRTGNGAAPGRFTVRRDRPAIDLPPNTAPRRPPGVVLRLASGSLAAQRCSLALPEA